jgi:excisionase family DNA binding protein
LIGSLCACLAHPLPEVIDVAEPWLSTEEIAAHVGIAKGTVYDRIADKAMHAQRVGRLWKFQVSEIDEWVRSVGAAPELHECAFEAER